MADEFTNWRIKPELHREIGIKARELGLKMHELAELSWLAYIRLSGAKTSSTPTAREEFNKPPTSARELRYHGALDLALNARGDRIAEVIISLLEGFAKDHGPVQTSGSRERAPKTRKASEIA